ncbi:PAS domain S-box protein [Sphingobacterium oryzagri]|uniref:histidine kinase n=1 Tax=Sphingobacterium oryzagri TaxID=3025669 RepID=A0ABY7WMA5_9SPHI|nr:PAS domain S-box protein [Sphingobacterium sp. KACC 22765]WDF70714.1 PAS domain S-box protein [Sphingobacterium sp. KACC 22765]
MIEKRPDDKADKKQFSVLREKAEQLLLSDPARLPKEGEVGVLLDELEVYELELQMQNEELRRSQELLERERAKFASLFDAAPVAYLVIDQTGVITSVNQRALDLLGVQFSGEVLGKNFSMFIAVDSHQRYYALLNEVAQFNSQAQRELRMLSSQQTDLFFQIDAVCHHHEGSDEPHYFMTLTDITPIRLAQNNLQETTDRFAQTLQASQTGTWMVNLSSQRIYFDEYAAQILHLPSEQTNIPITELAQLVIAEDRAKLDLLYEAHAPFSEIDMELRCAISPDERITLLIKGKQVQLPDNKEYLSGVLVDITARTRYQAHEEEKRKAQDRLIRRKSIEAQEKERERISAVLHDSVCQTLFGIRFNLSHLGLENSNLSGVAQVQQLIDQAIEELRSLSHELNPSILRDFGFVAGLDDMVKRLSSFGFQVKTNVSKLADKLPTEIQLYLFRIIQELLNNVIHHSGSNKADVSLTIENKTIALRVRDYGEGIRRELEDVAKRGTGLRTIISRVNLLSGTIELDYHKGARFRVCIPIKT